MKRQRSFGPHLICFLFALYRSIDWTRTFTTSLHNAKYCDVITGGKGFQGCTGGRYVETWSTRSGAYTYQYLYCSITVASGSFTITAPGRSTVAYHIGAKFQEAHLFSFLESTRRTILDAHQRSYFSHFILIYNPRRH